MSYPITAGDVFEAIQAGAREATLQMLKDVDFSTAQGQAQAKALLEQIEGKDFATQATLAQILTKLADPATQTTLAQVLSKLETVSDTLTDGSQKTTLTGQIVAIGDQAITVSDTAIGLTPPPGATYAVITVEVADIRFRIRGDTALPTPTEGHIAEVGDDLVLSSPQDIENFRAVVRDGIDATLFVTYSEVVV